MAGNVNATSCTKHMDIRYRYDMNEDENKSIVKMVFVKSTFTFLQMIYAENCIRDTQTKW